ncbi:MAG: hypothetical protein JSR89_18010 [Proteobacteria bacterium]|nr:hypothetical protein [Pseudomonadota bacterium]
MRKFKHVVSLGPTCLPAMQAKRYFDRSVFQSGPFNYQITPLAALRHYFENDFNVMIDRRDLIVDEVVCNGKLDKIVCNTKLGTLHPHQYTRGIDADFENERSRHGYLCEKLRGILNGGDGIIFVTCADDPNLATSEISEILDAYDPDIVYKIVCLPKPSTTAGWNSRLAHWMRAFDEVTSSVAVDPLESVKSQFRRLAKHVRELRF